MAYRNSYDIRAGIMFADVPPVEDKVIPSLGFNNDQDYASFPVMMT